MMMFLLWKWRLHGTLIPFFLLLFLQSLFSEPLSVAEDKIALLRFKSAAVDPAGLLSAWNSGDRTPCLWPGVSCNAGFRVTELNLSGGESGSGCSVSFASSACRKSSVVRRLSGALSRYVGSLTELTVLSLSFHDISGELPPEIGNLHQLEVLDLRCNYLTGKVPATFSVLSRLNYLNLAGNELNGTIPGFITTLQGLKGLFLEFNRFSGKIPDDTGMNCGSLERIHLGGNQLTGGIPWSLGNCVKLRSLLLFSNNLEGSIPENLGKIAMLEVLDVSRNSLSGIIPAALGNCLRLSVLVLSNVYEPGSPSKSQLDDGKGEYNLFEGSIPNEVTSLPNLRIIWAPHSNLIGSTPSNWGNCRRLEMVNLAQNFLTGSVPASLSDCKSLFFLDLSSNQLTGSLSAKLPVPCMTVFNVSGNLLSGSIPRFIDSSTCYGGCREVNGDPFDDPFSIYASFFTCNARVTSSVPVLASSESMMFMLHDFSRNNFTGTVPPLGISADKLKESPFYAFQASRNSLSGFVPAYIFYTCRGLSGLAVNLSDNELFGELPVLLGTTRCSSLKMLDLAGNSISGRLPLGIGHLDSLVFLDLSRNRLTGLIPDDLQQLKDLEYFSLASNNLTGTIPASLALLPSLKFLALHSNQLSGDIPWQLTNLRKLTVLLLDNNNLSGNIPPSFAGAVSLSAFNVSFNNLSGPVPSNVSAIGCSSVMGNPHLPLNLSCHFSATALSAASNTIQGQSYSSASPSPYLSPVSVNNGFTSIEIASIVSASAIVSVLLALVCLLLYTRKCAPRASRATAGRREVITFSNNTGVPLSFENVVRATGGFNASNCIGNGGFGATYKAEISPGVLVAVKRLSVGRFHGVQQFEAEIRTLGRVRHANLVTLLGFHASETEMFLIYNYLPGGNLEKFIRERSEGTVDWKVLHKIALDIARALAYLHDECVPRILHRDIKPSNILLDNNCTAYLSDFGLARLLGTSETHATTDVAGTFGYVAPEYAMTCRVSDKADVYSYGVVLMELISNKKALDPSFSSYGNGFNIVQWACMLLRQGQARDFFIQGLWDTGPHGIMVETLHLAVMCTVESLTIRPTMRQVVKRLKQLEPPTC